jgi:hypothetical protein
MTKDIKRYKFNPSTYNTLKFKKNNKIIKIDFKRLKKKYNLFSIIKFLPIDYKLIKKKFYHFNIFNSNHKKNKNYLVLKILKKGYFNNNVERMPIYSPKDLYIFKSFYIYEKIEIKKIKNFFLKKSLETTNTKKKLLNSLLRRYKFLLKINKKNFIHTKVSITGLEFVKKIKLNQLL